MSRTWKLSFALTALTALALTAAVEVAYSAIADGDLPVRFKKHDLSGPRLGVTTILGNGGQWDEVHENGVGRIVSQFGWHFERQIVPEAGGPQFIIEGIPLVGGVEYGKFIPSMTLAMGVRFPSGYEFGMGPNVVASSKSGTLSSSLILAVGKSFDYGGVILPVNLVMSTSPRGQRVSVILGYAIQRASSPLR